MPPDMTVRESHDICLALQDAIEVGWCRLSQSNPC